MLSGTSHSPPVMNRLTPSRCQVPSACRIALVRPAPTSEPASGSVSTMVPPQWCSIMVRAKTFCSGVPSSSITVANEGPDPYMKTAGLAPRISSAQAHRIDGEAPNPPSSSGRSSRYHSPCISALYECFSDSGRVTVAASGSKIGGLRSASS